jgi:hypothetical protein
METATLETEPTAEPTEAQAAEAKAGFAQGFAENSPTGDTPPAVPTETPSEEDKPEAKGSEVPAKEEAKEPEYAQLTVEEVAQLRQNIADLKSELRAEFGGVRDSLYGKIGGLERKIKEKQEETPSGQAVQFSAEDFKELAEEYPDLAKLTLAGFNRALGRTDMKGTAPAFDEAKVTELLTKTKQEAIEEAKKETQAAIEKVYLEQMDDLDEQYGSTRKDYKGWRTVTASPEYAAWIQTLPVTEQRTILDSWKPGVVLGSIKKFHQSLEAKAKETADPGEARRQRMRQGVPPKGESAATRGEASERDGFKAGFKENYRPVT